MSTFSAITLLQSKAQAEQLSDMLEAEAAEYAAEAAAAELLEERTCEIYSVHTVPSA